MAVISRIRAWRNPGFTEGGPKAPRVGHSLPNPDIDLSVDVHPSADRMFSELRLPVSFDEWRSICYLQITYEWTNESSTIYCGWVDGIDCISDSDSAAVTAVKWHVDEWGTWIGTAVLGYGHRLRRPASSSTSEPIQGYTPRYWTVSGTTDAVPLKTVAYSGGDYPVWWALVAYSAPSESVPATDKIIYFASWPLSEGPLYCRSGTTTGGFISSAYLFKGFWDEYLGIDPAAIYGAWILPCPPMGYRFTGTGTSADPIILDTLTGWELTSKSGSPSASLVANFYRTSGGGGGNAIYKNVFPIIETRTYAATPTERNPVKILGFDGSPVLELPTNLAVSSYEYRVIASATECYIGLRFHGINSKAEGLEATIPAMSLDLTENAWSSYVYSGQRQYDKDARYNESMKKGVESITSGVVGGALMGGLGPAGAVAGAAMGGLGGAVGAAVEFGWYNEASQDAKDKMMAKQSAGIIISGSPWDAVYYGGTVRFARMAMDNYSSTRITNERNQVGVKVDEYVTDNSSVKSSTGFYQIVNLEVNGNVPNSAKRFIANRFAQGVILI